MALSSAVTVGLTPMEYSECIITLLTTMDTELPKIAHIMLKQKDQKVEILSIECTWKDFLNF